MGEPSSFRTDVPTTPCAQASYWTTTNVSLGLRSMRVPGSPGSGARRNRSFGVRTPRPSEHRRSAAAAHSREHDDWRVGQRPTHACCNPTPPRPQWWTSRPKRKSAATAITATLTRTTLHGAHPRFNAGVFGRRARDPSPQGRDDVHLRGQGLMSRATFGDVQ